MQVPRTVSGRWRRGSIYTIAGKAINPPSHSDPAKGMFSDLVSLPGAPVGSSSSSGSSGDHSIRSEDPDFAMDCICRACEHVLCSISDLEVYMVCFLPQLCNATQQCCKEVHIRLQAQAVSRIYLQDNDTVSDKLRAGFRLRRHPMACAGNEVCAVCQCVRVKVRVRYSSAAF